MAIFLALHVLAIIAVQQRWRWGRLGVILTLVLNGALHFAANGTASLGDALPTLLLVALAMAISFSDSGRAYFRERRTRDRAVLLAAAA